VLFVGVDEAEHHHDVYVMAEGGEVLGKRRVPDSVVGIGDLHALVAEHADAMTGRLAGRFLSMPLGAGTDEGKTSLLRTSPKKA
jgi:hypothetical protein